MSSRTLPPTPRNSTLRSSKSETADSLVGPCHDSVFSDDNTYESVLDPDMCRFTVARCAKEEHVTDKFGYIIPMGEMTLVESKHFKTDTFRNELSQIPQKSQRLDKAGRKYSVTHEYAEMKHHGTINSDPGTSSNGISSSDDSNGSDSKHSHHNNYNLEEDSIQQGIDMNTQSVYITCVTKEGPSGSDLGDTFHLKGDRKFETPVSFATAGQVEKVGNDRDHSADVRHTYFSAMDLCENDERA